MGKYPLDNILLALEEASSLYTKDSYVRIHVSVVVCKCNNFSSKLYDPLCT